MLQRQLFSPHLLAGNFFFITPKTTFFNVAIPPSPQQSIANVTKRDEISINTHPYGFFQLTNNLGFEACQRIENQDMKNYKFWDAPFILVADEDRFQWFQGTYKNLKWNKKYSDI